MTIPLRAGPCALLITAGSQGHLTLTVTRIWTLQLPGYVIRVVQYLVFVCKHWNTSDVTDFASFALYMHEIIKHVLFLHLTTLLDVYKFKIVSF